MGTLLSLYFAIVRTKTTQISDPLQKSKGEKKGNHPELEQ